MTTEALLTEPAAQAAEQQVRTGQQFAHLNKQYPTSYWQVAFSSDVPASSVIPLRVLERDVVLWRDSNGVVHSHAAHCAHLGANLGYGGEVVKDTLRCPFHAWRYNAEGRVAAVPGVKGNPRSKACLPTYRVIERHGTIFLWNGPSEPDHDLPDVFAETGVKETDVYFEHVRYKVPFPAKWFAENLPDAAHFAGLHRLGSWGDTEVISESPTRLEYIAHFYGRSPYISWADLKRSYARGEMWGVSDASGGDFHATTFGGGLHFIHLTETPEELRAARMAVTKKLPRAMIALSEKVNELSDSARLILSFTPVDEDSHIVYLTMLVPRIKNPALQRAAKPLVRSLLVRRNWFAIMQDNSLMMFRQEPENPSYNRFDRGLVAFRKFWDSRVADRTLWAGDNIHAAGARARVIWPEDPASSRTATNGVA